MAAKRKPGDHPVASVKKAKLDSESTSHASLFDVDERSIAESRITSASSSVRPKKYLCNYPGCFKAFDRPVRLEAHFRTHTNDRPFACDAEGCDKAFFKSEHLKAHVQNKHSGDGDYLCTYVLHTTADGVEQKCGKTFTTGSRLKRHLAAHEEKEDLRCADCGTIFRKMETLQRHIKKEHLGEDAFVCKLPVLQQDPDGEDVEEECGQSFATVGQLKGHETREHSGNRFFCDLCTSTPDVTAPDDIDLAMVEIDRPGFRMFTELKLHKREVHPHTCSVCSKPCLSNRDLTAHLEIEHNILDRKPLYPCTHPDCDRIFTSSGNRIVHVRAVHDKIKKFVCGEFDLLGSESSRVKVPGWTNEMGCGAAFTTKASLEGHVRTQHLDLEPLRRKANRQRKRLEQSPPPVDSPMEIDPVPEAIAQLPIKKNSLLHLTGFGYDARRPLACPYAGCTKRFKRQYDVSQHCNVEHGAAKAVHFGRDESADDVFWVRGANDERPAWDDTMSSRDRFYDQSMVDDGTGGYEDMTGVVGPQVEAQQIDPALLAV